MAMLLGSAAGGGNTQVVNVGFFDDKFVDTYGYASSLFIGTCTDGTFDQISNAPILSLSWSTSNVVTFELSGVYSNAGWTDVTISGQTFTRASGTFTTTGSTTYWQWSSVTTNPFGFTPGVDVNCVFT